MRWKLKSLLFYFLFITIFIFSLGVKQADACQITCRDTIICGDGKSHTIGDPTSHTCYRPDGTCDDAAAVCHYDGNPAICSISFYTTCGPSSAPADTTPPTCNTASVGGIVVSPLPINSGVGSISIVSKASDNIAIKSAGLFILRPDGSLIGLRSNDNKTGISDLGNGLRQISTTWNTESAFGNYQIQANWTDTSGNFKQCTQYVPIDKSLPECSANPWTFSQPSPTSASNINITTTATDSGSGIVNGGIYYLGPLGSSNPPNTPIYPNNKPTTGTMTVSSFATPADGTYEFQANWWDARGNFRQCKQNYSFDKNRPTATISVPAQVCYNSLQNISVTANAPNGINEVQFNYSPTTIQNYRSSIPFSSGTGLTGTSYSHTISNYSISSTNGFSIGQSYYFVSNAYDDLGGNCTGSPFGIPSNWTDCGLSSRATVRIIDKPSTVTNLRNVSTALNFVVLRWTGASTNSASYTVTTPSGTSMQQNSPYCINGTNNCGANFFTGSCKNNYSFTVSENNTCGASLSSTITTSPNCAPTCSLSFTSVSNPFTPGSIAEISSATDAGDPGDYISSYSWSDNGPDKGSYYAKSLASAKYTTINRYSSSTTLVQSVYDSISSSYNGSCSIIVRTADPTVSVGPAYSIAITKSATTTTTQKSSAVYMTLLNDNDGTLKYNQSDNLTYNGKTYQNICKQTGVTCSFSSAWNSDQAFVSKASSAISKGIWITVPRTMPSGTYAYGMELSTTKWDNVTPIISQSNNLVTVNNLSPICSKPTLSGYSTYGVSGYPLSYLISVAATDVSDYDGTISQYDWDDPSAPGSGTLTPLTSVAPINSSSYTTPPVYNATNYISYSVTDNNGGRTICPISDPIATLIQPRVSSSWYNYMIDVSNKFTDLKYFTLTQAGVSVGFPVVSTFSIDTTSSKIGALDNICTIPSATCKFDDGTTSKTLTLNPSESISVSTHGVTVTVPVSINVKNYGISISGKNTYRNVDYPFIDTKTVVINKTVSDISLTCGDGSIGTCYSYTVNRDWTSGDLAFQIRSNGFNGTFSLSPDTTGICGVFGVTCTASIQDGFASLTYNASKTLYLKISTTAAVPPGNYSAKLKATGTLATVGTSTGEKLSPPAYITLLNQAPICGTPTFVFNPATPVGIGSTVKVTVGGGTDPDNDPLTYGSWAITGAKSITAISGTSDSANVVMNNVYNSCTEIRYKVYDNYFGVSSQCVSPATLCTIVDNIPPTATINASDSVCKGITYPVSVNFADNDNITNVEIYKKDPVSVIATKSDNLGKATSLSGSTVFNTAGTYYVYPVAKDANNNVCDSSGAISCGANTYKTVTVNENASAPTMSFSTYANDATKVRVTWTKPDAFGPGNYIFARSGTDGTLSGITCSGNDCGVDITGLSCSSNYSYNLQETDANSCKEISSISNVSPNCAPTCGAPSVKSSDIPPSGLYSLDTSVTINSNKKLGQNQFDDEDGNSVTHIWAPSLSGTGLGGITFGGSDATYKTPNRNNLTVLVNHFVRDTGGPNDNDFVTVSCGAVSFPMASDGLSTPVFSPGAKTLARTSNNPTGSSNFTYDLTNFQSGTFAVDTTNSNNANFVGGINICSLTSLITCTTSSIAPVGVGQSIPVTLTFKDNARVNFDTTKTYKAKGTISYVTKTASNEDVTKTAPAYLSVSVSDTAPTCKVYSRLSSSASWIDVTGQYYTYSSGTKILIKTEGTDIDGDSIEAYAWSASGGSVSPINTQESSYIVSTGLSSELNAKVTESAPNNKYGTCTTIMKTPDPGTHILSSNVPITAADRTLSVTYSYSGYVNANFNGTSTTGVNGSSTISKAAIPGYTNICAISGVSCNFSGLNVNDALTIPSGSASSKNIIINLGSVVLDNNLKYAVKVAFSAPTVDGVGITAGATGGTFVITDTSPTCGNITISPLGIFSGTTDSVTITAKGFDDWNIASAKLEYNSSFTGTNSGTWSTISTINSFSSGISPVATFNWQPGSLALGKYQLRVTWTDNHVPSQSIQCSALDASSPSDPTSPTNANNPVVSVYGNRISGRVLIQSDGASSTVAYYSASKDALGAFFGITNNDGFSSTTSTWNKASGTAGGNECKSSYPDGSADSNTCVDYFVSNNAYMFGTSMTSVVTVPVVGGTPKYLCTYDVIHRDLNGVRTIIKQNQSGCTASFIIEPGNSTYTSISRWTTEVDFYLTYNTDRLTGQVVNYSGSGLNGYDIYGGYGTKGTTSGNGVNSGKYTYPISLTNDSKDYLSDTPRSFTLSKSGDPIGTAASPDKCFYAFSNAGAAKSFTANEIKSISRGGTISGWTTGAGCTTPSLSVTHGNLSPQNQNYLYFFVVPKIIVNPESSVKFVSDCTTKGSQTVLPSADAPTINLFASDGTTQVGEGSYNTSTGKFSIYNQGTTVPTELLWNSTYVANLSMNVNYVVCDNRTPSFTVDENTSGLGHTEPNVNSGLPSYPSGTASDDQVIFNFYIALKNNNDWWQVYDGGVHANGIMDLVKLPHIDVSGTVTALPLVQNVNTGALVSSADTSTDIDFHDGKAGNSPYEWSASKNNAKMIMPYKSGDKFFDSVKNSGDWEEKSSFPSALSNNAPTYIKGDTKHISSTSNTSSRPIVIFGDFSIEKDLLSTSPEPLVIIVDGDVTIKYNVITIQSLIYATGNITMQTKGDETDLPLYVTGSLIAESLKFKRDLKNIPGNIGLPSQVVIFNPKVFSNDLIPNSMKEANAYWVVAD